MKRLLVIIFILFFEAGLATADVVQTSATGTKVAEINSYNNWPQGDTIIKVDSPHIDCQGGYWLKMSDIAYERNFSILLAAQISQKNVVIYSDNASIWPHQVKVCHITQVILKR